MLPDHLPACLSSLRLMLPGTKPRARRSLVSLFGFLLLTNALSARTEAQAPPLPAAPQPAPVRSPAPVTDVLNPMEQIETVLTGIVKQARGCVVTIEGRATSSSRSQFTFSTLPSHRSPAATRKAGQTAARATKEGQESAGESSDQSISLRLIHDGLPVSASGFLLDDGLVITTAEVAAGTKSPVIVFADGQRVMPIWVNSDAASNVAVYKLSQGESGKGLAWGDAARVFPGSFAITLGNQGGFGNSVALGLVSATNTAGTAGTRRYRSLIQFQGLVGDGGSGGPLLNARGQVIGMIVGAPAFAAPRITFTEPDAEGEQAANDDSSVSAQDETNAPKPDTKENPARRESVRPHRRQSDSALSGDFVFSTPGQAMPHTLLFGGLSNIGFAVPSGELQPIVARLLAQGGVSLPRQGWLGIKPSEAASAAGVQVQGIYIGGPADTAGLEPGDVILTLNGETLRVWHDMHRFLPFLTEGSAVHLKIRRGQTLLQKTLSIKARPGQNAIQQMKVREKQQVGDADERTDGPRWGGADSDNDGKAMGLKRDAERNFYWHRAV